MNNISFYKNDGVGGLRHHSVELESPPIAEEYDFLFLRDEISLIEEKGYEIAKYTQNNYFTE